MSHHPWQRPLAASQQGRDATRAQVVEAIDRTAPRTKADLASTVGISEQYLSELLQELKADGVVRKAYVVDDANVYADATGLSRLHGKADGEDTTPQTDRGPARSPTSRRTRLNRSLTSGTSPSSRSSNRTR